MIQEYNYKIGDRVRTKEGVGTIKSTSPWGLIAERGNKAFKYWILLDKNINSRRHDDFWEEEVFEYTELLD